MPFFWNHTLFSQMVEELTFVTSTSRKLFSSIGWAGPVRPPRRFRLRWPLVFIPWYWAPSPLGLVGSEVLKLHTTRAVELCIKYQYSGHFRHKWSRLTSMFRSCGSHDVKFLKNSKKVNPFSSWLLVRNQSWLMVSIGGRARATAYLSYNSIKMIKW